MTQKNLSARIKPGHLGIALALPVLACMLTLSAVPGLAETQSDAQSASAYFDRLDQNKDGGFTLADMQRIESKDFKRTDADQNGALSLDEYIYGIPPSRQDAITRYTKRFHLSDTDQNGRISMDEYMAFCARVVAAADLNKDGTVTRDEFLSVTTGE